MVYRASVYCHEIFFARLRSLCCCTATTLVRDDIELATLHSAIMALLLLELTSSDFSLIHDLRHARSSADQIVLPAPAEVAGSHHATGSILLILFRFVALVFLLALMIVRRSRQHRIVSHLSQSLKSDGQPSMWVRCHRRL